MLSFKDMGILQLFCSDDYIIDGLSRLFSLFQVLVSVVLFIIWDIIKKITYQSGLLIILSAGLVVSIFAIYDSRFLYLEILNFILSIKGFISVEMPIILAFLIAYKVKSLLFAPKNE
jgi:hypothetical protein